MTDKPIYVVPNGVDTEKFSPDRYSEEVRAEYADDDGILITYVGVTYVGAFKEWHG